MYERARGGKPCESVGVWDIYEKPKLGLRDWASTRVFGGGFCDFDVFVCLVLVVDSNIGSAVVVAIRSDGSFVRYVYCVAIKRVLSSSSWGRGELGYALRPPPPSLFSD